MLTKHLIVYSLPFVLNLFWFFFVGVGVRVDSLEGVVIVIDASCPARYLNCIQGRLTPDKKQLTHNVIIEMDPNPMILATDPNKGLQAMFKIKCITDIIADNECVHLMVHTMQQHKKILYLL